jgi:hypothetical protein
MKLFSLETTHQKEVDTIHGNFEEKQHRFMVSACESFKEFVDFAAPISEDSVHETFDRVLNAFRTISQRSRDGEDVVKELAEIRMIVGADHGVSTSCHVSALVKGYQECQVVRHQIENDRREALELLHRN